MLSWTKKRGDIPINPVERAERIYASNRAHRVWTKADLVRLLKGQPRGFQREVGESDHHRRDEQEPGTHRGRHPHRPQGARDPARDRPQGSGVVLTHTRGLPWTESGLETAMQRAKRGAGLKGLTFHDLRGTAATRLIRDGLPPPTPPRPWDGRLSTSNRSPAATSPPRRLPPACWSG